MHSDPRIPNILLIEDNDADAELVIDSLTSSGVVNPVLRFSDGDAALRHLQRTASDALPRLLLLDLNIGALDGLDVLRTIRSMSQLAHLPVIVLTGSNDASDRRVASELGAIAFVTKPMSAGDFFSAVRMLGESWVLVSEDPAVVGG